MCLFICVLFLMLLVFLLFGCGYNVIQQKDEVVKVSWFEVFNQYKCCVDLVFNLVQIVKGFVSQEECVLIEVINVCLCVGQINVNVDDEVLFKQFQQVQGEFGSVLLWLLVVIENYLVLKFDQNFCDLQVQLEGIENWIMVVCGCYIQQVQDYNIYICLFLQVIIVKIFGYKIKLNFIVDNEVQIFNVLVVDFGNVLQQQLVLQLGY